jgi:TRAP-type C4-dicarboxylate transport system substrate-binding protein
MKVITQLSRISALFVGLVLAASASAQVKWDMYTFVGVTHPIAVRLIGFAEEVKKQTNGQLVITVRPAGEFPFKATEIVRATGTGQVQLGQGYSGFISGAVEKVRSIIHKYADPEFKKQGVKALFTFDWPPQNIFGRGDQVTKADQLAGKKLRTTDAKQSEMLKVLGGSSVSLTTAEVPLAVERGVVQGFMTAAFNVVGAKWYDGINWAYMADVNAGGPDYVFVNLAAYNKLDPKVRETLEKVAAQWGPKMTRENNSDDAAALELLRTKYNVKVYRPTKEETDALAKRMIPVWDAWAKQHGPNAVAALKEIREKLGR